MTEENRDTDLWSRRFTTPEDSKLFQKDQYEEPLNCICSQRGKGTTPHEMVIIYKHVNNSERVM